MDQHLFSSILKFCHNNPKKVKTILEQWRIPNKKNGTFGYYQSYEEIERMLIDYILKNKIRNFLEIGSGVGILSRNIYQQVKESCYIQNIEICPETAELSESINKENFFKIKTTIKDCLELTKEDLENIDFIYLWEPFYGNEKGKKTKKLFLERILKNMPENCTIWYKEEFSAGYYTEIPNRGVSCFTKKSLKKPQPQI